MEAGRWDRDARDAPVRAAAMFDQEVAGPLSVKKPERTLVSSNVTRVEPELGDWASSVEGGRSWRGAVKVVAALVSTKVVIKNV